MPASATIAAQTFGTLGAICWSTQLLPQIRTNYLRGHTHGLQPTMMLLWASAGIPLGIYNITRAFPVALQIQPQILTFLSLVTWAQTKYYPPARDERPRSVRWCVGVLCVMCAVAAGTELGIVLGLRRAVKGRSETEIEYYGPVVLMGVLSAVLLCAGVGRHYVDIWKERTVRGISFLFVGIDALGDLTSLISVVCWWKAGQRLDVLGLAVYGSELLLWLGVIACGGWYNLRPLLKMKAEKQRSCANPDGLGQNVGRAGSDTENDVVCGMHRDGGSVTSGTSHASGTVFRTASGRDVGTEADQGNVDQSAAGHGGLRLRSVIQV